MGGWRDEIEERTDESGEVTRRFRRTLPDIPDDEERERDLRVHRTLSGSYPAGHEYLITANKAITVPAPGIFTKFRVLLRDTARVAWIALDEEVGSGFGAYDDLLPGGNELEEYCHPSRFLSIMLDGVPTTAVEVFLYGGRFARPK